MTPPRSLRSLFGCLLLALPACGARTSLHDPIRADAQVDATPDLGVDVPRLDVGFDVPPRDRDVGVDVAPDVPDAALADVPARVDVVCPSPVDSTQGATVSLAARATSSAGLPLVFQWSVDRPAPGSTAAPTPTDRADTRFTFDTGGDWLLRFTATDPLGHQGSCTVRASAAPAIELLCPDDQSNYQGATVPLAATASSALGLPLRFAWSVLARPAASTRAPSPADALTSSTLLDATGDWTLQLAARDPAGHTAACLTHVHADPDVIVSCPPDITQRPLTTATLAATASSRTGLPLTFRWEIEERPITSTATLAPTDALATTASLDVAGRWTYRFTAFSAHSGAATCTTRAFAASTEAVRVELVWNLDRSCVGCNPAGGGLDLDLHVSDVARSHGHWNELAPDRSDCYWDDCRCDAPGGVCAGGVLDWLPTGDFNNPQLDIDHNFDLPGPENINLLTAVAGSRFDVGVHFFGDNSATLGVQTTAAVVRVYCAGAVVFESEPVPMGPVRTTSNAGQDASGNPLWRVGQVVVTPGGCTFARCGGPGAVAACIRPAREW